MNTKLPSAVLALFVSLAAAACAAPTDGETGDANLQLHDGLSAESLPGALAGDPDLTLSSVGMTICGETKQTKVASMFGIFDQSTGEKCLPKQYDRGIGVPMKCASGLIQSGAICYRPCKAGYTMVAGVCWQSACPAGFRDDGAMCAKPAAYGRGFGYAAWQEAKCEAAHPEGCEEDGLMWYPKCREGFHHVASNFCSPDCPSGMTDTGVSCLKKTYVQSSSNTTPISYSPWPNLDTPIFTAPLSTCPTAKSERYHDLCYTPCAEGFKGSNNLCNYVE
jgi:hypothetical protein